MEKTAVQKLAGVLKILVTITFVCNLIVLPLVPVLVSAAGCQIPLPELLGNLTAEAPLPGDDWPYFSPGLPYENPLEVPLRVGIAFVLSWGWVWTAGVYEVVLALFLLFCGICTAVILWQGRRVLGTILTGAPFRAENGVSLRRAAVCCFLIAAAALARVVWGLFYYGSIAPLLTYNALFVPIFILGGLLCLVMSALFRQAAELKAENDLTI